MSLFVVFLKYFTKTILRLLPPALIYGDHYPEMRSHYCHFIFDIELLKTQF